MESRRFLHPSDLETLGALRAREAREVNAIAPIETETEVLHTPLGPFLLHVARQLRDKPRNRQPGGTRPDPFVPPYEPSLYVGALPGRWHVLLNKYPVLPRHFLFVPERFEPQEAPWDEASFRAACFALEALDGLLFYNAGATAGASQPHRHLQLLGLPLHQDAPPVPLLEAVLRRRLPVRFAVLSTPRTPAAWPAAYARLFREAAWSPERPHNLLATRSHTWLVPRSRECWRDVSVNALGFAGSLFVPDRERASSLRAAGPSAILGAVGLPPLSARGVGDAGAPP